MCAADCVEVEIGGMSAEIKTKERRLHPKNESMGVVPLYLFNKIIIEVDDAQLCEDGEEARTNPKP